MIGWDLDSDWISMVWGRIGLDGVGRGRSKGGMV